MRADRTILFFARTDSLAKANPYHDRLGRFARAPGEGGGGSSGLAVAGRPRHAGPMRRLGFGGHIPRPIFLFDSDAPLKAHPDYRAAKAGDEEAAIRLVRDLAAPLALRAQATFPPGAIYVAPDAKEAAGDNAIPGVLATAIAAQANGRPDTEIVQANRAYHTGADPMERRLCTLQTRRKS